MQKRAHKKTEEVLLVPFLDILCSLIGVLVLIIVVLCVAQMQKINAVDPADVQRAIEAQKIKKQMAVDQKANAENLALQKDLEEKMRQLQRMQEEYDDIVKLRKLADASAATAELNKLEEIKLAKELDDLATETDGLVKQQPPLVSEIEKLEKKIAELKIPDAPVGKVVIQRPASGIKSGAHLYFLDCSAQQIKYFLEPTNKKTVSNSPETITSDPEFNAFLKAVKRDTNGQIVMMIRDDGWGAYRSVSGWAVERGIAPSDISKMAVPGSKDADLSSFGLTMGKLKEFDIKKNMDGPFSSDKPGDAKPAEANKP